MLNDIVIPSNDYNYDPVISSNSVLLTNMIPSPKDKYLLTDNYLSEYESLVLKKKVRDNLEVYSKEGINNIIYDILSAVNSSKINLVNAEVDNNIGNPEVDVNFSNNILSFNFRNLKGKSFTYDDLTEELKAELARPGVEAVGDVKTEFNKNITQGVNLLKGSDTTLLDNISTGQISSASIEGKQNDGWWRVKVPNGTTDGEIFIEQDISLPTAGKYTFSCEIKSDGDLSAHVRFHAVNYDYNLIIDRIDKLSEHHYRVVGSFDYDGNRSIRKFDIYHINAPNSTYIDIRFPMLSQTDDYIPWQPSIYDLTEIRLELKQSSSLDDAPSDGNIYGRRDRIWTKTVGRIDSNNSTGEIFNNYNKNTAIGDYSHVEGTSTEKAYEGSTIPSDVQQIMMDWYMSITGFSMSYGKASHVEGKDCLATGDYAHAEGMKTLAANDGAHAEGTGTNAAGIYAHAEGQNTTAYASACHAEGGMCVCNGNYGHVEGFRTQVENTAGHAEGYITYCRANYGHVEGRQTNSIGPCAHAEGYGNKIDRSITITGIENIENVSSSFTADNTSDLKVGACFIIDYIPYVVTNIADGNIYVNRWIEFKQQKYDIIIMYGAAYGNNAHTEGELGSAIGNNSHVSGMSCIAFNDNETACGHYNFSFWSDDNAKRTLYSIGIGESDSNRKNAYELKENGDLYIYGVGGYTGKNSSEAKTIQKVITEQQQGGSGGGIEDAPSDGYTYGRNNGAWTRTVGRKTGAIYGEAFNSSSNQVTGSYSHAEGNATQARGDYGSHAEGTGTAARGHYSHTEGYYTIAKNNGEHALGLYNMSNKGNITADMTIHSVGIGISSKRKNAHEIMRNGDHYIYGIGGYDGTNYSEAKTLQTVITELTTLIETLLTTINELKGKQA